MFYAFDLDGTLVDSHDAVLAAYRHVGVEPPPNFFSLPWREWLHDEKKHDQKNEVYIDQFLILVKPLPLLLLYHSIGDTQNQRIIMTGASRDAALAIADRFGLDHKTMHYEMSVDVKIRRMNTMYTGIMFEDQQEAATKMRKETQWTICHTLP